MNGDLDNLIQAWSSPLVGLFSAWGASASDAQELTQDVFVEAWLGRERCRFGLHEVDAVGPWLRGIGLNLWRSHRRKRRRERPLEALGAEPVSGPQGTVTEDIQALGVPAAPSPGQPPCGPHGELRAAIARLPKGQREAVWVRYLEDRSSAEAAAILGLGEHALAGRLWRARVALKARLNAAPASATDTTRKNQQ